MLHSNEKARLKKLIIQWEKANYDSDARIIRRGRFDLYKCYKNFISWNLSNQFHTSYSDQFCIEKKDFYNVFRRMVKNKEIDWLYKEERFLTRDEANNTVQEVTFLFHKRRHGIYNGSQTNKWYFHNDCPLGSDELVAWMKDRELKTLDDPGDMLAATLAFNLNLNGDLNSMIINGDFYPWPRSVDRWASPLKNKNIVVNDQMLC